MKWLSEVLKVKISNGFFFTEFDHKSKKETEECVLQRDLEDCIYDFLEKKDVYCLREELECGSEELHIFFAGDAYNKYLPFYKPFENPLLKKFYKRDAKIKFKKLLDAFAKQKPKPKHKHTLNPNKEDIREPQTEHKEDINKTQTCVNPAQNAEK